MEWRQIESQGETDLSGGLPTGKAYWVEKSFSSSRGAGTLRTQAATEEAGGKQRGSIFRHQGFLKPLCSNFNHNILLKRHEI